MQIVALSPDAWQQYQELRRAQKHSDLARLYEALYQEAHEKGIPMADPYARELAEWMAAVETKPDDLDARQNLARLYRARADAVPALRLNYLLLLAEQMEAMREQTGDVETAKELVSVYEEASRIASENGDSTAALKYLTQASAVPGAGSPDNQEMLSLRLALSLAQEGQVAEALRQVESILAPEVRQMLERYMPPFSSARAEMVTGPSESTVRYQLFLYAPAVKETHARLDELAALLRALENCQASWYASAIPAGDAPTTVPITATFSMTMTYASPAVLQAGSQAVVESLASDPDLISAFVAAPWRAAPTTYRVERELWQDRFLYEATADLTPVQVPWEEGADYVRWQLVELRSTVPESERAQIERQLAVFMLEQQSQVWELIPAGTYYVQRVVHPDLPHYQPSWLVSWGQERILRASQGFYRWDRVLGAAGGAILLLVALLSRMLRRL